MQNCFPDKFYKALKNKDINSDEKELENNENKRKLTHNQLVAGSSPAGPTIIKPLTDEIRKWLFLFDIISDAHLSLFLPDDILQKQSLLTLAKK